MKICLDETKEIVVDYDPEDMEGDHHCYSCVVIQDENGEGYAIPIMLFANDEEDARKKIFGGLSFMPGVSIIKVSTVVVSEENEMVLMKILLKKHL